MVPINGLTFHSRKESLALTSDDKETKKSLELPKVTTVEDEAEAPIKQESDQP